MPTSTVTGFPTGAPFAFGSLTTADVAARPRWSDLAWRIGPPWLQRTWGVKFLSALLTPLDALEELMAAAVRARFPQWNAPDALSLIGRERRIRRGRAEPSGTYARRLRRWLDDHRLRGGPRALLRQMRAYWLDVHDVPMDVVNHSGGRTRVDTNEAFTRDVITWGADGTAEWAQFWVFMFLASDPGAVTPEQEAEFLLIPREWTAAHILREHVVLVWGFGRMWDYPPPEGDWDDWETGLTWAAWDAQAPIVITHEEA